MSKLHNASRAAQARKRRERKRKQLEDLWHLANAPDASSFVKREYEAAFERHTKFLKTESTRVATWRKKLAADIAKGVPNAVEKAKRNKEAKRASYLKRKNQGRIKTLKTQKRSVRKIKYIKEKLEQQQNINGYWVPWRKGLWTPLGVAIKLGHLEAVRWLLENDASPSKCCTQTLVVKPLKLAVEENKPEIVQILLETDELRDESRSHGALHWAIHHQMFEVVKSFIEKGYDLNEYFMDKTPLGASLNCWKARSGDARLVKRLLDANADVRKQSKICTRLTVMVSVLSW